jgi:hypothetical protein
MAAIGEHDSKASDPADLTFARFQSALHGEGNYPSGAVFIDAEASYAQAALLRNIREGRPAVVIYPDGLERIVETSTPPSSGWALRWARALRLKQRPAQV